MISDIVKCIEHFFTLKLNVCMYIESQSELAYAINEKKYSWNSKLQGFYTKISNLRLIYSIQKYISNFISIRPRSFIIQNDSRTKNEDAKSILDFFIQFLPRS